MNQTNRADAAERYLKATGFTPNPESKMQIEFTFTKAPPYGPWWREKENRLAKLPRMRYLNNLGVYQLTDVKGVRVFGNDIESTYLRWIQSELDLNAAREAAEDFSDMRACCYEDSLPILSLKTLGWSAVGLLLIIATAALYCVFNR